MILKQLFYKLYSYTRYIKGSSVLYRCVSCVSCNSSFKWIVGELRHAPKTSKSCRLLGFLLLVRGGVKKKKKEKKKKTSLLSLFIVYIQMLFSTYTLTCGTIFTYTLMCVMFLNWACLIGILHLGGETLSTLCVHVRACVRAEECRSVWQTAQHYLCCTHHSPPLMTHLTSPESKNTRESKTSLRQFVCEAVVKL